LIIKCKRSFHIHT